MCGIVTVLTRAATRPIPTAEEILAALDGAIACGTDLDGLAERASQADRLLRGVARRPGVGGPAVGRCRDRSPPGRARRLRRRPRVAGRGGPGRWSSRHRDDQLGVGAGQGRLVGAAPRPAAHGGRRQRSGRSGRGAGRAGWLLLGAVGAVGHRPAGGPGSGLGRRAPVPVGPRPALRRRRAGQPTRPPGPGPPLSVGSRPAGPRHAVVRLQGRGGDRGAGRQHRRAAGGDPRRRAAPSGPGLAVRAGGGARSHPLGQRRHHLRAQHAPGQQRGGPRHRRSLRGGGPERRCRQPRRSAGPCRLGDPGTDHHRRQGDPRPGVARGPRRP